MIGFFALLLVEAVRWRRALVAQQASLPRAYALQSSLLCLLRFGRDARRARAAQVAGKGLLDLVGIETGNGIDIGF